MTSAHQYSVDATLFVKEETLLVFEWRGGNPVAKLRGLGGKLIREIYRAKSFVFVEENCGTCK